jgi:hypothetical protein
MDLSLESFGIITCVRDFYPLRAEFIIILNKFKAYNSYMKSI